MATRPAGQLWHEGVSMGLLDLMNSDAGMVLAAGLLDAGAAKPVRTGTMQGIAQSLLGAQQYKQSQEERAMKQKMLQAQLEEQQAQAAQRQAQAEELKRRQAEAMRIQSLLQGAVSPVSGVQANAASGITGPRPEALQSVGQPKAIDYQSLIAQGVPPELVQKLAESRNYGRDKVARTIDGRDEQGRPVTYQQDEYGNRVGAPIQQWKAPEKIDTGGQIGMLDPTTMQILAQFKKTNTPDALLSAQTTMRGQNMANDRAREKNQIDKEAVGKVDWKQDVNGNWIALPKEVNGSGPVTPVTTTTPGKREQQARNALDIIAAAEPLIDKATGSYAGAGVDLAGRALGMSTPGANAGAQLKALEGALMMAQPRMEGPQSDKDVALYRQMAAQIGDPTVPAAQKKAALSEVKKLHMKYAGGNVPAPAAGPSLDDLLKKYGN